MALLPGLVVLACLAVLFRSTLAEMIAIYERSSTFAHAFLVPPISVWLIWRLRHALAPLPIQPRPWMLVGVAAACLLWFVGELALVNAAAQFGVVTAIILIVPTVYGFKVARALMFPLAYLYFAVPFGLFLLPVMMEATADFTVSALQLSGIPVYREGLQFVIPSGSWSVVEACSGVRYLIASFMVGTLFAYLNYTSTRRRVAFILFALLMPIVANWLRAYMIVMLGHLSGNTLAVGVDHLIYGWVFFGIVIGIMFMVGARWAQPNDPPQAAGALPAATTQAFSGSVWITAVALVTLLALAQSWMWSLNRPHSKPLPALQLPSQLGADWKLSAAPLSNWKPLYEGTRAVEQQTYQSVDASKPAVAVWLGYYRDQGNSNRAVTANNQLSRIEDNGWAHGKESLQILEVAGQPITFRSVEISGPGDLGGAFTQRLLLWKVYWLQDDQYIASDARAKVMLGINRIRGLGDDAAVLMFYTPMPGGKGKDSSEAEAVLRQFVGAHLPELSRRLEAMAQVDPKSP